MGKLIYGEKIEVPKIGFITLSEPACGSGGMVLAFVKNMIDQNLNPAETLWCQCIDIDRTVALMCYIQLSLWNVPAQIIVGNSLTMEFRETFFTPAHYVNGWNYKLRTRDMLNSIKSLFSTEDVISDEDCKAENVDEISIMGFSVKRLQKYQ